MGVILRHKLATSCVTFFLNFVSCVPEFLQIIGQICAFDGGTLFNILVLYETLNSLPQNSV